MLTAVDSALMVIDCAKGVEEPQTIKLMDVCRLRDTPIMTFIKQAGPRGRARPSNCSTSESVLGIQCAPVTWPIGMGSRLKGVVHLLSGEVHLFEPGRKLRAGRIRPSSPLDDPRLAAIGEDMLRELRDELELVRASHAVRCRGLPRRQTRRRCSSARR